MPKHTRAAVLATLTAAALAAGTALAAPAGAAAPPTFLAASELPPHPSSDWNAGPVTHAPVIPDGHER